MKKLLIFWLAAMTMTMVSAATLTLTTSDGSGKSSFDTWNVSGGGTAAPSSDNDYVVSNNRYIRILWNRTFGGNSLSFGVVGGSAGQLIIQRGDSAAGHTIGFGNNGAILNNGAFRPWESNRTPTISSAGPLTVNSPENAPFRIAAAEVTSTSSNTNNSYTIAAPCATPTFSPAAGEVEKGSTVEISCDTDGATIYYTTDGTDPTTGSTAYTGAITINSNMTIKAIAVKDGYANSAVASAAYTIRDYATLPFAFDNGKGNLPSGMTHSGLGTDYGSSPKLKFDNTDDYLILKINEVPGTLAFDIKGNGSGSDPWAGTFKVQTSVDGESYSDLKAYTSLGDKTTEKFILGSTVRYIKWVYTNKSIGNVALGNINLSAYSSTISITPAKEYTTLTCPYPLDFSGVTGLEAYIATEVSGGSVLMTQVNNVPANTGLVIKKTGSAASYDVPVLTGAAEDVTANKMAGSAIETTAIAANAGYILSNGVFQPSSGGDLPAGKAYLNITYSPTAPVLNLNFGDDTTGIKVIDNGQLTIDNYYNLAGQRVTQPTKGLYIVNGKKVVIK